MWNENIKKRRLKLGMTLEDVGIAVGVTRATIQRYESGDIANINTKMIMKLADALQCTPSQLVGWEALPETSNIKLDELITLCYKLEDHQLQLIIDTVKSFRKVWDDIF